MLAAWAAMFGAALTVAGCFAAGVLALRWSGAKLDRVERVPLAFLLGAGCLHLAVFAVMAARIAYKPVWWILLGGLIVTACVLKQPNHAEAQRTRRAADWTLAALFAVIFAAFTVMYVVNAWAPETSADGAGYHLGVLAQYLRARGFVPMPTNMYASLGQGVEMVYAPAFALGKHSAAALVHVAFAITLGLAIFAYGRRIGKPWVGAAAATIVYVSPVVGKDATTAYIDVATGAIVFAAFYWLQIWDEQRNPRLLAIAGFMAGYAFAAKYTMFVMVLYALLFVAWKTRRVRTVAIFAAGAVLTCAPWLIKNWIFMHDPLAPFATRTFPSPYIHTLAVEDWAEWLRRYDIPNLWSLPLEDTVRGRWTQGIAGPIFLLAPLGLLALRDRIGRRVLLLGAVLLATYFGNIGTRFLIPCLPFFALAMALAVQKWKPALAAMVAVQAIASWPPVILAYANQYVWRLDDFPYQAALGIASREEYLRTHLFGYERAKMIESQVAPQDKILDLAGLEESYTSRQVIAPFPGALNNTLMDVLDMVQQEEWQVRRAFVFRVPDQRTQHIRVVQTAQGKKLEEWNVHELRFYSRGVEVPRSSAWRIRAWPNPWEIQYAFDNSDATRWRSWQTGQPGMFIEVNFGDVEEVDEIRMFSSIDYHWDIRFEVQTGSAGKWTKVTDSFEETPAKPRGYMPRAATYELYAHGIRYILVDDAHRLADAFFDNPEGWGIELVARAASTSLYRILP
ncbi:MAG TPA: glycosyltransferase family 39 protein [Bryobacteraceae bacterium]|nr:glycosyltransferase family 39 protein [Bryobacteraceae bacterium]